jgi:hypothetical protein
MEHAMANREQRPNKEKKKPKKGKEPLASAKAAPQPAYVPPELVRKPHKGKDPF